MVKVMFSSGSRAWANNLNDLRERWNLRREEPVRFVVPVDLFREDLKSLSREDLNSFHAELLKLLNAGKKELFRAKNLSYYEGVRMESDDYSDLLYTVKSIGTHVEEVKNALSNIKRRRKDSVIGHFLEIARERMDEEVFYQWLRDAGERADNE